MSNQVQADVRSDLLSDADFERNCAHYADWAFYTPPERFLFHHYDEPANIPLVCQRPMIGMEKYVVNGIAGGFFGVYDTKTIAKYLKNGTWIELPSERFFAELDVASAKEKLDKAVEHLNSL